MKLTRKLTRRCRNRISTVHRPGYMTNRTHLYRHNVSHFDARLHLWKICEVCTIQVLEAELVTQFRCIRSDRTSSCCEGSVVGKADKRTAVLVTGLHPCGISNAFLAPELGRWVGAISLIGFMSAATRDRAGGSQRPLWPLTVHCKQFKPWRVPLYCYLLFDHSTFIKSVQKR